MEETFEEHFEYHSRNFYEQMQFSKEISSRYTANSFFST